MKSFKNETSFFQHQRDQFVVEITGLQGGSTLRNSLCRVEARKFLSREESFRASNNTTGSIDCSFVNLNVEDNDFDCILSFGEYLYEVMNEQSIFPRHIAEETELSREYVDHILEDEIFPWDLPSNFIRYLNQRLNLDPEKTKLIIAQHDISHDIVEKFYYSSFEYDSIDSIDPEYRKLRLNEFIQQEELRKKSFLQLI